jgi:Holliday junction resolvase RusA-like endonuclease
VWLQAQHAGMRPFAGPIAMYVHVYRARKVGDLDNSAKVLADSLNGIAYQDDSQIVEWHLWRHDDKANPRVEVEIRQVAP